MSGSLFDTTQGVAQGLLVPGNINLSRRPVVQNPDGSISTVRSMNFTDDTGRSILIPTVVGGQVVPEHEAIAHYYRTGEHLGIFDSDAAAEAYAQSLHESQARQYAAPNTGSSIDSFVSLLMKAFQ